MKLLLGLGNPGPEYDRTRHNAGWWALDRIAYDWGVGPFRKEGAGSLIEVVREGEEVHLLKPMTYMNRSGMVLRPYLSREGFDPETDLLVMVDDVALPPGKIRIRPGGSPGGHNGLKSIDQVLGGGNYPRLRVGVGRPPPGGDLAAWVLSEMPPEEEERVLALLPDLAGAVDLWVREGTQKVMNESNG